MRSLFDRTVDAVQSSPVAYSAASCFSSRACRLRLCWLTVQHTTSQLDVQVTGAEAALRKMLPLIFSKEQGGYLLLHACWACPACD